jgi:hypothetical protein
MYHRYGRHGPHAWRRRRQRRFQQRLPAVVPTVAVVRVRVPITTERIILIIMSDGNVYEGLEETQLQFDGDQTGNLVVVPEQSVISNTDIIKRLPSSDASLIEEAQWQAYQDAGEVADILKKEPLVRIHGPRVEERIKRVVRAYLEKNRPKGGPPGIHERDRLLSVSKKAYWEYFYQEIPHDKTRLITTSQEAELRNQAILDRKKYSTYASEQSHRRDLAVIRVLSVLDLHLDHENDDHLEQIHDFADKYEYYFRTFGEEVIWPAQDSF